MIRVNRVVVIVLDSVGIGFLPDAGDYGDKGSDTLGHIFEKCPDIAIPHLLSMGIGNISHTARIPGTDQPLAAYGRAMEKSAGKDTTTGHWEIAGVVLDKPFPTFPDGFPEDFIKKLETAIGTRVIGNISASGTEIISRMGEEHMQTGFPIVYTSADSVFQMAMHEEIIPIEKQYEYCQTARHLLKGDWEVGRVIARPFFGSEGHFVRTERRKDFSLEPPYTVLDAAADKGLEVYGIGKVHDIFAGKGLTRYVKTPDNDTGIIKTIEALKEDTSGIIFTNLVDFDMLYGHRRDWRGYAACLEKFDAALPEIWKALKSDDLLIITADHGNDPTWTGTDHTREYIPILNYGEKVRKGVDTGTRMSFSDIAATISEALGLGYLSQGQSYWHKICTLS